jgi:transcriptional regulator with XRE-family HTH domain
MSEITTIRKALGLTQVEFAQRMSVRQSTVSRWETGVMTPTERDLLAARYLLTVREGCNFPALCRRSKPGPCERCQNKNKRDADTAKRAAKQRRPSLRRAG